MTDVTSRPKNPSDIKDIAITPLTLPATSGRMLGLPTVGRLAYFAQHPGPVVLLTTAERLEQFSKLQAFGTPASINPDLTTWADKHPHVVVDVAHALTNFPDNPDGYNLVLTHGERYGRDALLDTLVTFGYERDAWPGFIVRGDTITLYFDEDDETDSLKLEFFGDELDTITHQGEACDSYKVQPLASAELAVEDGEQVWTTRLLEHLPGQILLDSGELVNGELGSDAAAHWFWEHLAEREVVSFGRDELDLEVIESPLEPLSYYRAKLTEFATDVEMWLKDGYSVSLLLKFERTGRYLRERVLDQLETAWHSQLAHRPGKVSLIVGNAASGGYRNTSTGDIVLTEDLLYGYQGTRKLKRLPGHAVNDASALTIGDYLVHPDHGIGKFMGLEPRQVVGVTRDYLILQYSGEGKLYLPVEQLPLLRRHPGTSDDPPRLSTLGTNEWARARERARVNAQAMAAELIKTYAKRQVASGVALAAVDDWDELIGANCPFDLTDDQREAVRQTWDDMAKTIPMDRLISGDVGFGKTEVAIRAAHRAVGNSKQVAMLVPTTVLAKQHLETFQSRFAGLPVRVAMLSRFATDKEARTIVKELADGTLDIVVGTHRLLNENIKFKDLGLLIIDEEHRFGGWAKRTHERPQSQFRHFVIIRHAHSAYALHEFGGLARCIADYDTPARSQTYSNCLATVRPTGDSRCHVV
ncbi:MAG: DEAD/DEAH box helicase [Deinococcota bacterium]